MRLLIPLFALAFAAVTLRSQTPAPAVEAKASQAAAAAKYPQLAVANSPLNKLFVQRYNDLTAVGDSHFQRPDWPMWLADYCAGELRRRTIAAQPTPVPHTPAKMGQTSLDQPASGVSYGTVQISGGTSHRNSERAYERIQPSDSTAPQGALDQPAKPVGVHVVFRHVLQVLPDGLLVNTRNGTTALVQGYPLQTRVVDGALCKFEAEEVGTYQYVTTDGSNATVKRYAYKSGDVLNPR